MYTRFPHHSLLVVLDRKLWFCHTYVNGDLDWRGGWFFLKSQRQRRDFLILNNDENMFQLLLTLIPLLTFALWWPPDWSRGQSWWEIFHMMDIQYSKNGKNCTVNNLGMSCGIIKLPLAKIKIVWIFFFLLQASWASAPFEQNVKKCWF